MLDRLQRAIYRVWQFRQAVGATVSPNELEEARRILTSSEMSLFEAMPLVDQRHCLDAFHYLSDKNCDDILLLKASLLHDAGKTAHGRTMRLMERVVVVLLDAVSPSIAAFLASSNPANSRYGFYLHVKHQRLGAEQLERAGSDPIVIELVRGHEGPATTSASILLKQADEAN